MAVNKSYGLTMNVENQYFPNYTGYVIQKAFPKDTYALGRYMIFCDKFNQSRCELFQPNIAMYEFSILDAKKWNRPKFVREMNSSIFETIGGVIDYNFGGKARPGYVLLFNIEGKPKYCFTPRDDFSEEVRHKKQLIPNYYSEHYFSANHRRL